MTETEIETETILNNPKFYYTFEWAKVGPYADWITCPSQFQTMSDAAEHAGDWLAVAYENGLSVQVRLRKIGGLDV